MDPDQVKAAIEALKNGDAQAALTILEALIVAAATGEAAPAEGAEPVDALAADPEPPPAKLAALSALRTKTGAASLSEALIILDAWKASHDKQEANAKALAESGRAIMVAELVKLGAETPATAWEGEGKDRKVCARLSAEPVESMRARLVSLRAAHGGAPRNIQPPAASPGAGAEASAAGGKNIQTSQGVIALSAEEIKNCEEVGAKLEVYAENKAARDAARKAQAQ